PRGLRRPESHWTTHRPLDIFLVEQVLDCPVVNDQRTTGVKGRKLVRLFRVRWWLTGGGQTGAQQLVDLVSEPGAALGASTRQRSSDVIVERQRRAHEPSVDGWHQSINWVMRRRSVGD